MIIQVTAKNVRDDFLGGRSVHTSTVEFRLVFLSSCVRSNYFVHFVSRFDGQLQ